MTPLDLAAWQTRLGLSQVEAARLLNMPVQSYRNLLKGRRHAENLPGTISRLCQFIEQTAGTSSSATAPHRVLSVTAGEIRALDEKLLVELLRQLLHVEAELFGLLRSGIHVPAQIHMGDEGEDGRIEWAGGPEHTRFLSSRLVLFQVKATDMSPAKCAAEMREKDGSIKPQIGAAIDKGGTYVIFCNRPSTQANIDRRIAKMRQTLESAGVANPGAVKLEFWDSNKIADWSNSHYPVALWLIERVRSGGVLPFQSLESWASEKNVADFRFVADPRAAKVSAEIEQKLSGSKSVLRLVGPSGLGKTRLALEALRTAPTGLRSRVLYTHSGFGGENILSVVQAIREHRKSAIIVVDDCSLELHKQLAAIVEHVESQLSLLTIDYDPEGVSAEYATLEIERAQDHVIIDIIRQVATIDDADANRLVRFAQGFPQIAVLIAKAWPFDTHDISSLTDAGLVEKMVFGRRAPDPELLRVARALSLYEVVGVDGEAIEELEFVALIAGVDFDVAYDHVQTLKEHGIAQQRGRFVQIQPKPLALSLAADAWEHLSPKKINELVSNAIPTRLQVALFRQFAKLDGVDKTKQIAARLCAPGKPFADAAFLDDETHAECLAYIAEVNPSAATGALERAYGAMSAANLQEIRHGRRWLVWTLERLCFRKETFHRAAKLMLDFAVAENEDRIANNATGTFKALFKVYLSGTETPAIDRLSVLDQALESEDPRRLEVAIYALEQGLETNHFTRTGGPEWQGSGPSLKDWQPATTGEIFTYYRECLERLSKIACRADDLSVVAKTNLAGHIRGLVGQGLVDNVTLAVDRILAVDNSYWPEAIEETSQSLSFEGPKLPPDYRKKVQALHDKLIPRSLEERLRLYVCELPWGYFQPGDDGAEAGIRWAKALAEECASHWEEFLILIPMLLTGEQRYTHSFGQHILEASPDQEELIDLVVAHLKAIPKEKKNAALLGGLLSSAEKRDPVMVDRKLDAVASDPELIGFLPWLTAQTSIETHDLERIARTLGVGSVAPENVRILARGSVLSHLSPTDVAPLVDALLVAGTRGYWAAVEIMGMYAYQKPERFEGLRQQTRRMMAGFELAKLGQSQTVMDANHFGTIATWLIRHGSRDEDAATVAAHLTEQAVRWCIERQQNHIGPSVVESILPEVLTHCADIGWPILSNGIVEHRDRIWTFQHLLGKPYAEGKSAAGPIFLVPWKVLRAWSHRNPDFAPAFLMRIAPVFDEGSTAQKNPDRSWSQIVLDLLDEFGDRQNVLSALSDNMMTFLCSGSMVPYHEQYKKPLQSLLSHHRPSVVAWARGQLEAQEKFVRSEQSRDEEQEFSIY
jgi:hypothetical protein